MPGRSLVQKAVKLARRDAVLEAVQLLSGAPCAQRCQGLSAHARVPAGGTLANNVQETARKHTDRPSLVGALRHIYRFRLKNCLNATLIS